jgi:hypothetical protein
LIKFDPESWSADPQRRFVIELTGAGHSRRALCPNP